MKPVRAVLRAVLQAVRVAALALALQGAAAETATPAAADPALEARMLAVASELRCLVCQNQTIADSHSGLAEDLRREVRELLRKGATADEVRRYMTERYGDFVLYRPPFKASTALLWLGPALLFVLALATLVFTLRRRARLDASQFEADADADADDEAGAGAGDRR